MGGSERELLELFAEHEDSPDPEVRLYAAKVAFELGELHGGYEESGTAEALRWYLRALDILAELDGPEMLEWAAPTAHHVVALQAQFGDPRVLETSSTWVARLYGRVVPEDVPAVADLTLLHAECLLDADEDHRIEEAAGWLRRVVDDYGRPPYTDADRTAALGLQLLGRASEQADDPAAALRAYRQVAERWPRSERPSIRDAVAEALAGIASLSLQQLRPRLIRPALIELRDHYGKDALGTRARTLADWARDALEQDTRRPWSRKRRG